MPTRTGAFSQRHDLIVSTLVNLDFHACSVHRLAAHDMIAIIDYGMGNLRSVQKAFEATGHAATITASADTIRSADRIVLPGVGAFGDAIRALRESGLDEVIVELIGRGRPFLGICLGMQLLFERGLEGGPHPGLGVLAGDVPRFDLPPEFKVPHMGWNQIRWSRHNPLWEGVSPDAYVYFVHSYFVRPTHPEVVALTTDYGGPFCAAVLKDNVFATQFHPEKSQNVGLALIRNFATWKP